MEYTPYLRAKDAVLNAEIDMDNHQRGPVKNMAEWEAEHDRLQAQYEDAVKTKREEFQKAWDSDPHPVW